MRKSIITAALIGFIATTAHAVEVRFKATWDAPTQCVDNRPCTATGYVLYVCDKPVTEVMTSGPIAASDFVGRCEGNMHTYTSDTTLVIGSYQSVVDKGMLYMRVTARREDSAGKVYESAMSEQTVYEYEKFVTDEEIALMKPPGKPTAASPRYEVTWE